MGYPGYHTKLTVPRLAKPSLNGQRCFKSGEVQHQIQHMAPYSKRHTNACIDKLFERYKKKKEKKRKSLKKNL